MLTGEAFLAVLAVLTLLAVLAGLAAVGASLIAARARRSGPAAKPPNEAGPLTGPPAGTGDQPTGDELLRLTEAADLGIIHVGRDGRITLANGPAHSLLGRQPGSLLNESPIAAFLDHRVDDLLSQAAGGGSGQLDLPLLGEPQRTLLLHAEGDASGSGKWLVISDVSELRRLRRIRSEFIDNLSHELRTPLTTLRVLAEVLSGEAERTQLPERVRDAIAKIDVETGHLVQMVTELLDLARIEQGETPLRREQVDLGQVVEDAISRLRPYAERQGVPLRAEIPGPPVERTVEGDADRLGQLLLNLLHNAIKFSEPGGEVVTRVTPAGANVRLAVADQGPGIPRRDLERIFERFYKVDRARKRGGASGTGLGLAIARHIAEGHGGRIWAQSEEGKGALFIVELPRPQESA
jgi:two-component system, OmpR family, phosphate regulon sensor histidine kinase PhoR